MEITIGTWAAFIAGIIVMLIIDLKVVRRDPHEMRLKEAALYSTFWVLLGTSFTILIFDGWRICN